MLVALSRSFAAPVEISPVNICSPTLPATSVAISSSIIRELLQFGGDPTDLMPDNIDIKNYL